MNLKGATKEDTAGGKVAEPSHGEIWLESVRLPAKAILCGSAATLIEEFELSRKHWTDAEVIVVNEAGRVIHARHLMTQHPEKALWFRERSLNPLITVHTAKNKSRATQAGIDVYWPDCTTLATSGGSAIAIALKMGFENIVLCGMPMNGGDGYFQGSAMQQDEPRFGLESPESDYIQGYQRKLIEFSENEPEALERVRSLSGFTRELFGPPTWL